MLKFTLWYITSIVCHWIGDRTIVLAYVHQSSIWPSLRPWMERWKVPPSGNSIVLLTHVAKDSEPWTGVFWRNGLLVLNISGALLFDFVLATVYPWPFLSITVFISAPEHPGRQIDDRFCSHWICERLSQKPMWREELICQLITTYSLISRDGGEDAG